MHEVNPMIRVLFNIWAYLSTGATLQNATSRRDWDQRRHQFLFSFFLKKRLVSPMGKLNLIASWHIRFATV